MNIGISCPDIQYYMDEPVADPAAIALYFLSEEASKKVKVVLSGEGSDELFGGTISIANLWSTRHLIRFLWGYAVSWEVCGILSAAWNERQRIPHASRKDIGGTLFRQCDEYFHGA